MTANSVNPPLTTGNYYGKLIYHEETGSYDFISKYIYKSEYNDILEIHEYKEVPFNAIIRDIPKDTYAIDLVDGNILKGYSLNKQQIPGYTDIFRVSPSLKIIAELYEAGKVEIEGRDAAKDAIHARRAYEQAERDGLKYSFKSIAEAIRKRNERRPKRVALKEKYCNGNCFNCQCMSCTRGGEHSCAPNPWPADECACCRPQYVPGRGESHTCVNFAHLWPGSSQKHQLNAAGKLETICFDKNQEWGKPFLGFLVNGEYINEPVSGDAKGDEDNVRSAAVGPS
jgi:hypothetical protein